jgi:hypothetical protein
MITSFDDVGAIGVIKDIPGHEVPEQAWTDAENMRFYNGSAEKFKGHVGVYESSSASPSIQVSPYWLHAVVTADSYFWLYAGLSKVYATDGTTHADLSATASVSANATTGWNGGMLGGGLLVLNNGGDLPLVWGDNSAGPSLAKPMQTLPNWPASTTCRVMRVYREYLVAMDITESSIRDRTLVWWSHPAEPRQIPVSWDYTNPSYQSGRYPLTMDKGYVVDGKPMRDSFMIYKEHSVWGMQWIGGTEVMRFTRVFSEAGMLTEDCAADMFGQHVVLGDGDAYIHDGQQAESILTRKWRTALYNDIDATYYRRSFVVPNIEYNEVWLCYVSTGTTASDTNLIQPNKALVWNFKQNTFSVRDLPNAPFITTGIPSGIVVATFDADAGEFNASGDTFDDITYTPQKERLIAAYPHATDPRMLQMDYGESFLGVAPTVTLERVALSIGRQGRDGSMKMDLQHKKFVRRVYPRITGTDGGVVNVHIGLSDKVGTTPTWAGPYAYTIGTTRFLTIHKRARIVSIKFSSDTAITWKLTGFDIDVRVEGER